MAGGLGDPALSAMIAFASKTRSLDSFPYKAPGRRRHWAGQTAMIAGAQGISSECKECKP